MKQIANLLFEARSLEDRVRSGYSFLGNGNETIAEHTFTTTFICFVMARLVPGMDKEKMISMALVHDLAEARTGDFNYVEKKYADVDEAKAVSHLVKDIPFGNDIRELIEEFNLGQSEEARLVNDADQLSFILQLKKKQDTGAKGPEKWLPFVLERLKTDLGKRMAQAILETGWDEWWTKDYSE